MTVLHNSSHPGEILLEYLDGMKLDTASAKIGIQFSRLVSITKRNSLLRSDEIQLLAKYYNTSTKYWKNINDNYVKFIDEIKSYTQVGSELPVNNVWYSIRILSDMTENAVDEFILSYHLGNIFYKLEVDKDNPRLSQLTVVDKPITHFKLIHLGT